MNNPNSFSYTFSANPAPRQPRPEPELFAVDRLSEFGLSSEQLLARNPRTGGQLVMPGEHFNTLVSYCSVFRTLEEHVAELMKGSDGAPERAAAIRQVVQAFRDNGLTIAAVDPCRERAPATGALPISAKPVVVIITCDRPPLLERLLGSVVANCDLAAVDRLFVVDDSRSAENAARNRELTAAAGAAKAVPFDYFGAEEARNLLGALVRQLPEHEQEIRFLIDRKRWQDHESFGVARNFSHLLSIGRPVVVFDDDALCEAWDVPYRKSGVVFAEGQQEFAAYADNAEWRKLVVPHGRDPVAAHMRCLGLTVPEALGVLGLERLPQSALRPASRDFARQLARDSRVLITECGSLGDPGTGNNRWLANIPPASRERLLAQGGRLQQALERRCCWLGRGRPEFRPGSKISQVTGFDNRGFLPPYFPVVRGEDRLFGLMLGYIYPGSVALEYPWAVPHLPMPERKWTREDNLHSLSGHFPGTLVEAPLQSRDDCLAADPLPRLAFLGRVFEDLAAAPDAALLNRLAEDRHRYRAAQIRRLKARVEEAVALPEDWRSYVEEALRQVEASTLGDLRLDRLQGTVGNLEGAALLRFWREAWGHFGRALPVWGEVRNAAREILIETYPG